MRHSSENIQQHLRPFTATITTNTSNASSTNIGESNDFHSANVNSDTILSLLNSHASVNNNSSSNKYLNINRSVSSPITGKLGRELSVAGVNALYNEYCTATDKKISLYESNKNISMNRLHTSAASTILAKSEHRKGTPIPDDISSDNVNNNLAKNESLMEDLDDIIESPKLSNTRYPQKNETNIWINTSTASDETVAADSNVLMGQKSTDR